MMMRSAVRLPMPGTAWKRAASPAAIAVSSSRGAPPESTASATLGPRLDAEEHEEQLALVLGGEAVELDAVVAQHEVRVQQRLLPGARHVAQRLGRTASR